MRVIVALFCCRALASGSFKGAAVQESAKPAYSSIGLFEDHGDVGMVIHPGSVGFDAAKQTYTISASGEDMWAAKDEFHFVWKKFSGDISLSADISFVGKGVNERRKAVLVIRQSLDTDSPYADVALHGSGRAAECAVNFDRLKLS